MLYKKSKYYNWNRILTDIKKIQKVTILFFVMLMCTTQFHLYAQETAAERANHAVTFQQSGAVAWESIAPGFMNVPVNVILKGDTITVAIDIGGLLQSTDRGQTWKVITYNSPGGMTNELTTDFDIHPTNDQLMIVAGNGMFRTVDGGTVWQEINSGLPIPAWGTTTSIFGQVKFNSSGSVVFAAMGSKVFMPTGWENVLYNHHTDKSIYVSYDGGVSWIEKIIETGGFAMVRRIYAHPTQPDIAYVSFDDGTFYLIENADNANISFTEITLPNDLFVRDMVVSPNNINEMMLTLTTMTASTQTSHLYRGINATLPTMTLSEIPIGTFPGLKKEDFLSVGYNSGLQNQLVIGDFSSRMLLITENDGTTFSTVELPPSLYSAYKLSNFYGNVERVWFGKNNENYAVAASRVGMWITEDNFNSFQDLTMEEQGGYLGNKGVGTPANINAISITDSNIYFSAQDHKAFKTKDGDYTKWKPLLASVDHPYFPTQTAPWGQLPWHWKIEKIVASDDENYLYINCLSYANSYLGFSASKKIFRSINKGDLWVDVTANLGLGSIYPSGDSFVKVLFDPNDSDKHWLLFGKKIHYTQDGGITFTEVTSPVFPSFSVNDYEYTDIVYDDINDIIYLSVGHKATKLWSTVLSPSMTLYKSIDNGVSWSVMNVGQNDIQSLGVKADGTLFIGTGRTGATPAHFIVLPFNTLYTSAHIKMTIADVPEEEKANQLRFAHIRVSGDDVLVYSDIKWAISDRFYAQGPYLSRDGGDTFKFIQWDLPHNNIWSLDMKDGVIALGTTFGLMRVDLDSIKVKTSYIDTISACNSYTWIDGNTYSSSNNSATHLLINPTGFDSLATLNLTITTIDATTTTSNETITANQTGATYQWIDCTDNTAITGATNVSYTATEIGDYSVLVSQNGCSETSSCVTISTVNINENSFGATIILFPNPTTGFITLELGELTDVQITITDLSGKVIYTHKQVTNPTLNISMKGFANGTYLLEVIKENERRVFNVIKQ